MTDEKPARGKDLYSPIKLIENATLVTSDGAIAELVSGAHGRLPAGCQIRDLGNAVILPPLANAHTHLQLSWLKNRTLWRQGFSAWLKSMVPQLLAVPENAFRDNDNIYTKAARNALIRLLKDGILNLGDVGGSIPGACAFIGQFAKKAKINNVSFCEWFGFTGSDPSPWMPWPERCRREITGNADLEKTCMPAGHGLYSTDPQIMRKAHAWCARNGKIFSFHLAESDEETELLLHGKGVLYDFYANKVLPPEWKPPRERPLALANKLGILDASTLAVHGVKLNDDEIKTLAKTGAALCLCPRSNINLGVGLPPVKKLLESGALLCLGTDGLTSNSDLNVANEGHFLLEHYDIPRDAIWRMLTSNGAAALGLPPASAMLGKGNRAFSVWRE